jgi:tellurite methyltransferase
MSTGPHEHHKSHEPGAIPAARDADGSTAGGPKGSEVRKKAADFAADRDWSGYFQAVLGKPPRDTLVRALDLFDQEPRAGRYAVDLGCGEGRDTLELLRRGWRVLATDAHPEAFAHLTPRVQGEARERLQIVAMPFERLHIPPADLVNASYCLPFCDGGEFAGLWARIVAAIRPGGRFAGQFFGDRDEWIRCGHTLHLTRAQVEESLRGFEIEWLEEEEKDDVMATGGMKHWHVFHVVARKR